MKGTPVTEQLWDVARTLRTRVRSFFDAPLPPTAPPLELLQGALDELERKVQPSGRGSRIFPYTRVVVHVAQPAADRAAIEAVFAQLETRLRERLVEVRCEIPVALEVSVSVSDGGDGESPVLRVDCGNAAGTPSRSQIAATIPELRVRVVKGHCDRADYTFMGGVVSIGRGAEPSDALGRVRRNDIAFGDGRDGITETVARAHARIEFDPAAGAYLLFNESSTNPTFLLRGGRSLRVTPRDRRGVRVASGDDVQLGRAIVNIAIADGA
jgi:hypothetical protein